MAFIRRLVQSPMVSSFLSWLTACYIRFIWHSGRWHIENDEIPRHLIDTGKPFVACFWHGRMLMIPNAWRYQASMRILISQHRDGVFISQTLRHLGVGTIRGSSTRGGRGALIAIVNALKQGGYVGITPDGPTGPRMRVAPGTITAAKLSGAALLPVSYGAAHRKILATWDRFLLPMPFSKGVIRIGTPILISPDATATEVEAARNNLELELIALTDAIDIDLGVTPVEPAPINPSEKPIASSKPQ